MGRKVIDITGQIFGNWKVIKKDEARENRRAYWLCQCSCGNPELYSIAGTSLRSGKSKSCNHCTRFDIIGKKFNHLTVLELDLDYKINNNISNRCLYYKCLCDCGNIITTEGAHLRSGASKSCGCLTTEKAQARIIDLQGQNFGYLTAEFLTDKRKSRRAVWHCKCICGNECDVASNDLLEGSVQSCGCLVSTGEKNIQILLQNNDIQFETQKTFEDLINPKTGYKLRYDFYLPEYNRLIEFDGEQHYSYRQDSTGWNNKENFEKTQERDKIKNEYAFSHNISLVRIPYWKRKKITLEDLLGREYLYSQKEA